VNKYLVFLFCCFAVNGNCQTNCDCFDRLYRLALTFPDELKYVNVLKDAISFLGPEQKGEYYWQVAESYNSLKLYDSSVAWYKKAIEWGYDIESLKSHAWETYIRMDTNEVKAITFAHRKKIDFGLYERFIRQNTLDQAVRGDDLYSENDVDTSAPLCKRAFIDSMYSKVDRSTYHFLMWVFNNYRFPTFHQLGFYPVGISAFILHVTAYRNTHATAILNKLEELSRTCDYQKSDVLFLKDRQKYYNDRKSYCGLIGSGQRYLKIEDISKADSIRFEYNLVRLKEEAAMWSGELPKEYKPRPYPEHYFCLKKYQIE
jgi:tetratricopeptide (TPR) repeat protein